MSKLDLSTIRQVSFPEDQYYREKHDKKQIVLHHTVSGRGAQNDIAYWASNHARIATCIMIDWKGAIHQCFSSRYWAHHLGVKVRTFGEYGIPYIYKHNLTRGKYIANNELLNQHSIAIEFDTWGGLLSDGKGGWKNYLGKSLPRERVVEFPSGFRGYYAFERYTDEMLRAAEQLLSYWHEQYGIPLDYNEDMWDVSKNALSGKSGVYSHVSFRPDKSDCCPQPELMQMLKGL